jgi:hypothetical protein
MSLRADRPEVFGVPSYCPMATPQKIELAMENSWMKIRGARNLRSEMSLHFHSFLGGGGDSFLETRMSGHCNCDSNIGALGVPMSSHYCNVHLVALEVLVAG